MWNWDDDGVLEGTYLSAEPNQGPKQNSTIHSFKTEKGEEIFCWGSTVLDGKLKHVESHYGFGNVKTRIKFLGMQKSKTGTNYKDYDVECWDEELDDVITSEDLDKINNEIHE